MTTPTTRPIATIFCIAAMLVAGCGKGSPKDATDWSYNPPDGFQQQNDQRKGDTVFIGPTDDGFKANLLVHSGQDSNDGAKQMADTNLAKATKGTGVTIKEQETYPIADSDAYTWKISKQMTNGTVADQRQFVVVKNGIFVEFTITGADKAFDKYDQALADSLQSFKWGR